MSKIQVAIILMCVLPMTGCTYSSHFDCPVGEGNKCTSLSQNDKKIDRGEYEELPSLDMDSESEASFYFREDFER